MSVTTSSPTTHASWPHGRYVTAPGLDFELLTVLHLDVQGAGGVVLGMGCLSHGFGSSHRLDVGSTTAILGSKTSLPIVPLSISTISA